MNFNRLVLSLAVAAGLAVSISALFTISAQAAEGERGRILQKLMERRQAGESGDDIASGFSRGGRRGQQQDGESPGRKVTAADLPPGTRIIKDVPYGADKLQTFDVYAPPEARNAPILVMVHGGGWQHGDKGGVHMVADKVKYWQPKGYIYISVNYRLYPQAQITDEADDVAAALALIQKQAKTWGGDSSRIVMMGHSAGAHLVALLSANPALAFRKGVRPWAGTVVLDSAMLNAVEQMTNNPYPRLSKRIYEGPLGTDRNYWEEVSPYHQLVADAVPMLIVCSSKRKDSCPQAHQFSEKAKKLGVLASVNEESLSHGEILGNTGKHGLYTEKIDAAISGFLGRSSLSEVPAR